MVADLSGPESPIGADPAIRRTIDVDAPLDEVWRLIGTAEGWSRWLVDDADLLDPDLTGGGIVTDDGERRWVAVEEIVAGERLSFRWGRVVGDDADGLGDVSTVDIRLAPATGGGSRISIVERPIAGAATSSLRAVDRSVSDCSIRWEVRAVALWLGCHVVMVSR